MRPLPSSTPSPLDRRLADLFGPPPGLEQEMDDATLLCLLMTRTMLERMRAKTLLSRRDVHGVAVYSQVRPKVEVLNLLMRRFSTLLDMDGALPAAAFSGSQLLSDSDIAELETLLNANEGGDDDA